MATCTQTVDLKPLVTVNSREALTCEVRRGLIARPRSLSPWMFYDAEGSRLFERITTVPEYYPTRTERAILAEYADAIVIGAHSDRSLPLRLVELGAGSASKTCILLEAALRLSDDVAYVPVDVCSNALELACQNVACALPEVRIQPIVRNYVTHPLQLDPFDGTTLALYIGTSIGNCGASEIASLVASRLGWSLWDERLTQEIARLTESTPEAVERREWRADPLVYSLFQDFLRGGFEGGLPPTNRLHLLDARRIASVSETAVNTALSSGPSVIAGRGSQYFLRNRKDVFHVFLYASRDHKIRRMIARGATQDKAIEQIDTTDKARAAFVRQYLGLKWREPDLYHAMFNTEMGESCTATMLVECAKLFDCEDE